MKPKSLPFIAFEHKRDAYGFAVRPQHLQRYKEYAGIYKVEDTRPLTFFNLHCLVWTSYMPSGAVFAGGGRGEIR
jgi:hypothetical protein